MTNNWSSHSRDLSTSLTSPSSFTMSLSQQSSARAWYTSNAAISWRRRQSPLPNHQGGKDHSDCTSPTSEPYPCKVRRYRHHILNSCPDGEGMDKLTAGHRLKNYRVGKPRRIGRKKRGLVVEEGRYNFGYHRHIPSLEAVGYSSIFGECRTHC
jgi:hypothetical protein